MDNLTSVWREVQSWPPEQQQAFANRLLQSLQQRGGPSPVSPERKNALQHLIGIWQTVAPPNDEQVKRIVEQERMKKYR